MSAVAPVEVTASNLAFLARYEVRACRDPNVLSRVVELFALNDLTPLQVNMRRYDTGVMALRVVVDGLSEQRAQTIAHKMSNLYCVDAVDLEFWLASPNAVARAA